MKLKTAQKWFDKICSALNECELRIQKQPRIGRKAFDGICDFVDETISIKNNPNTNNIELTLIHEALHHLYPDWPEKKVELMAKRLLCNFTTTHLKKLRQYLRRRR